MKTQRLEYPRPQLKRNEWISLNGIWQFEFDDENKGVEKGYHYLNKEKFDMKINVPFTYQYELSGINIKEHHEIMWYKKDFSLDKEQLKKSALLCFNGVDYIADVYVNGNHVITHEGGFSPFNVEISKYLKEENTIVVRCEDSLSPTIPRGKQSWKNDPFGCWYTPNSGIWQSVWIEFFNKDCLKAYTLTTDIDNCSFSGELTTLNNIANKAKLKVAYKGQAVKYQEFSLDGKYTRYTVSLMELDFVDESFWWSPERPNLFNLTIELYKDDELLDKVDTRFGMRKISIDKDGYICLNNKPYYQRLILDQGYFANSGLTPPSVEDIKKDIELAKKMGFNGARKHQKFEDPYFYYLADELGYLTWCEMPSGYNFNSDEQTKLITQWQEIVKEARCFTSVICYVPLNESWGVRKILNNKSQQDFARSLYYISKSLDQSRLVSTNDGWENLDITDITSIHDYAFSGEEIKKNYSDKEKINSMYQTFRKVMAEGCTYKGQPILLSEFGGIAMRKDEKDGNWGYNQGAEDNEEYYKRYENLIDGINEAYFQGFCFTQLSDVQQEINGLLDANHNPKFDIDRIYQLTTKHC